MATQSTAELGEIWPDRFPFVVEGDEDGRTTAHRPIRQPRAHWSGWLWHPIRMAKWKLAAPGSYPSVIHRPWRQILRARRRWAAELKANPPGTPRSYVPLPRHHLHTEVIRWDIGEDGVPHVGKTASVVDGELVSTYDRHE